MGEKLAVDRAFVQPRCDELFLSMETKFRSFHVLNDKWYFTALGSLATTSEAHLADQLCLYLVSQPEYSTAPARQASIRRMREVLFKNIALLGLPKPTEALIAISRMRAEDGVDLSFSREGWRYEEGNHARGMAWLRTIYAHSSVALFDLFKRHRDFGFWVGEIAYGLHLSGRSIPSNLETEMAVLPAVMGQDLPRVTY
jgi:hypothetical protein